MNQEMQMIWEEIIADVTTMAAITQLGVIVLALIIACMINGGMQAYVMHNSPEHWKVGIGGINRVLFPLLTLAMVQIGMFVMRHLQHTSLLNLASMLLFAMAIIRLLVYAARYIISPGGVLKTLENTLSGLIWMLFVLHISGFLSEIISVSKEIEFTIGKTTINLLVIFQAVLTIFMTIFTALWLSRMVENKLMQHSNINMNMRVVMSKVLRISFLFIAILIGLSVVGLDLTLLSVFGGALGIGLGFGLQRIASNFVSGFILLLDNSMQIGDIITVNELHYGSIADLRTRYLVLKKLDGTEVIVPNEMLITNTVINHSFIDRNTRVLLEIQVAYDSDLDLVLTLLRKAALDHPRVLATPEPASMIIAFADSGVVMSLALWIADPENGQLVLKSDIYLTIWKLFKANHISIPFPQREIKILNQQ